MKNLKKFIPSVKKPRLSGWLLTSVLLLGTIGLVSPQQLPVVVYKLSLITLAAVLGYWLDRALFPYARPDGYLARDWRYGTDEPEGEVDYPVVQAYIRVFTAAMLRRAIVVGCVVLGIAAGL